MRHLKTFERNIGKIVWEKPKYSCGDLLIIKYHMDIIFQITEQKLGGDYQYFVESTRLNLRGETINHGEGYWIKNDDVLRKLEDHEIQALRYNL